MNGALFRSRHVAIGSALALGLVVWAIIDRNGDVLGGQPTRTFRFASGWAALVFMGIVMLYVLRKYAHRGGYSPEFLVRTDFAKIEVATRGLQRLEADRQGASAKELGRVRKEAAKIVRAAGGHRVMAARVEHDEAGALRVRIVPTEPLGRMARWMGAHVGYGVAFAGAVLVHAGVTSDSGLGGWLLGTSFVCVVTGILGSFLWAIGPRWLTEAERDLTIEEAYALDESLARKLRAAKKETDGPVSDADLRALTQQRALVKTELAALRRVRWKIMGWKLIHVPTALVLTALVALHVFVVLSY